MLLSIVIILLSVGIVYSDFKSRLVPVWMLLLLSITVVCQGLLALTIKAYVTIIIINLILIVALFFGVSLLYWLKYRKFEYLVGKSLGGGDLVFILVSGLYFGPLVFIAFQIMSTLSLLLFFGVYILISKSKNYLIPMAGGQALLLIGFEIYSLISGSTIQYRDDLILSYLLI